jgi:DNA topoisomerase-1
MVAFGEALPSIRAGVQVELRRKGLPREKVLATVVRLLDLTLIRVGNDEYARKNRSYGLTTLRDDHVDVRGPRIRFHFRGKSGKEHFIEVEDKKLAAIVRRCQEIPGHMLFQYFDEDGRPRVVESGDVNDYLRSLTTCDFTAKDFRTWAGTVLAASALATSPGFSSQRQAKRQLVAAIRDVAEKLGNTPAVCRKSYVHPVVIGRFLSSPHPARVRRRLPHRAGLSREEAELLALLRSRAKDDIALRVSA